MIWYFLNINLLRSQVYKSPYVAPINKAAIDIGKYLKPTFLFIGVRHVYDIKKQVIPPKAEF